MKVGPYHLRSWLRGEGRLGDLGERARDMMQLQRSLQRVLPANATDHWRLARLDRDELALVAESPAWASQLRFRSAALLEQAGRLTDGRPRRCRITVDPPRLARRGSPPHLSASGAESLRAAARTTDDPRLREALLRLASREE